MPVRRDHRLDRRRIRTVLCDLDGVVWLAHRPIPGSVDAIARIRTTGARVLFVTNNSFARRADHERSLGAIGIPAAGDVVSSAMAAAQLVERGERVLITGGPGIVEAVEERGAVALLNDGSRTAAELAGVDAVVVGIDRAFDYRRLTVAAAAAREGARLIGSNSDPTYPTPDGLQPGGGSMLAAVAAAAGVEPVVAGKPNPPIVDLVREMISADGVHPTPDSILMVGDRPDTDGEMARRLGCSFALVGTGVTDSGAEIGSVDAHRFDDLAAIADVLTASSPARSSRHEYSPDMAKNPIQKLLDAGIEFTNVSNKQAERAVKELVKAGVVRKRDTEKVVQTLVDRGRETGDRLVEAVQREVARQVGWLSERFDELEDRLEDLADALAERVRDAESEPQPMMEKSAPSRAPRKAAGRKKSAAKKTTGRKKAAAKKTTAKKSTAKKSTAKKSTAKKTTGRKKTAAKRSAGGAPAVARSRAPRASASKDSVTSEMNPLGSI